MADNILPSNTSKWAYCAIPYELCVELSEIFESPVKLFLFLGASYPSQSFIVDSCLKTINKNCSYNKLQAESEVHFKVIDSETQETLEEFNVDLAEINMSLQKQLEKFKEVLILQKIQQNNVDSNSGSRQKKEFLFESRLEAFLQVNGIEVERQVASNQKRIDLWIPGQLMIECKAGKVTGDDICQAVDYLATFERDVLLVGTGMTTAASRGIEAVNKLSSECKLLFVTQEACFGYLKAVCS